MGIKKPVLSLKDKRSAIRFFQTKIITPTFRNALEHVLSFHITLGHIPGKADLAAEYQSRIHISPKEKLELRMNSRVPMYEIELNTACTVCHLSSSQDNDTPKFMKTYLLESKQTSGEDPMKFRADVQMQILKPATQQKNSMREQNPPDEFITNVHGRLDLRAEQQQDENIKRVLLWFERGSPTTGKFLSSDLKKYLKLFPRLAITEGVLLQKFYNHTGNQFIKQYCVPLHLQKEVLYRIHNSVSSGHK